jgi:hypothetical protein
MTPPAGALPSIIVQSRGPDHFESGPGLYFRASRDAKLAMDYRAVPLTLRAERRGLHHSKDMSCEDPEAPLRGPAQALQASPLRI